MTAELEKRRQARERERLELHFSAFVQAAWHVTEPTKPLVWGWPQEAVCLHAQALVEGWMRVQLALIGTLPKLSTQPLPKEQAAREAEERRRHHAAGLWREARRLGVLEDEAAGRVGPVSKYVQPFRKLLVNIPPGYTKSRILSVMLPAWVWLRWPSFSAFALSTNPNVALRDADSCRDVVKSAWYRATFQPWWSFSGTVDAKGRYANTAGGWRLSKGWEAKITGDRADLLILDDPNDAKEVWSEAERENVMEGWRGLRSRLNDVDYSIILGVQQRLHPKDWSGQVLKDEPGEWEHLKIQQEKTEKNACSCVTCARGHTLVVDPDTGAYWRDVRAPGALAMESRFSRRYVDGEKRYTLTWAAQHQQEPLVAEGNLYKATWWKFWRYAYEAEPPPELAARCITLDPDTLQEEVLSWDCAFKATEGSSKVAGGAWARKGPDKFLMDLVWEQLDFVGTWRALEAQAARRPKAHLKLVEDKANGPAVISTLKDKVPGLVEFKVSEYGSKEARCVATSWHVEGGNVYLPVNAPWRDRYIEAHSQAPRGEGMDAVDQQSQALLRMQEDETAARESAALSAW